jgi:hypothetical protein
MTDEFSFARKEILKRKIENLTKEKHVANYKPLHSLDKISDSYFAVEHIKKIILKYNPKINITTNATGHHLYFHNLTKDTYSEISNYIDILNSQSKKETDSFTIMQTDTEMEVSEVSNNKMKYNNQEKNLIKRRNYDEMIKSINEQNNGDSEGDDNDGTVFVKKEKQ